MDLEPLSEEQKEAAKFLDRDFNQCFQQMRHYDGQTLDIYKFSFTGYIAVIGSALALFKYGVDKNIDYTIPSATILVVALLVGLLLLALVARNRVYFVLVTRYVNEHRRHFLMQKPGGFTNETRMYTNAAQPPYFSWRSSQAFVLYLMAILNASLLGIALALLLSNGCLDCVWPVACSTALLAAQLACAILYLRSRENKSASAAVWGRE